tara:strand:+ start:19465 stop:20310 length:846 start_codon:yes stop_codon:yes gene_type:complete
MSSETLEIKSTDNTPSEEKQVADLKEQGIDINTMADADGNQIKIEENDGAVESLANTEDERPEWLPEKFKNAEDLSKAYSELEKKLSTDKQVTDNPKEKVEESKTDLSIPKATEEKAGVSTLDKFYSEYSENGSLTEDSYTELAKQGLNKDLVDTYIAGQKAIAENQSASIFDTVGGKDKYQELMTWAGENLSESDVASYNSITDTGSVDQIKFAVQGLMAQAGMNKSKQPDLFQGDVNVQNTKSFNSLAQVTEAINDPRYTTDPVYRKEVEDKIDKSNVF